MNILTLKIRLTNTPLYRRVEVLDCIDLLMLSQIAEIVFSMYDAESMTYGFKSGKKTGSPTGPLGRKRIKVGDDILYDINDESNVVWHIEVIVEEIRPYKYTAKDYEPECLEARFPDPLFEDDREKNDVRYFMSHWDEYMYNCLPRTVEDYSLELHEYWNLIYPNGGKPKKPEDGARIIPMDNKDWSR